LGLILISCNQITRYERLNWDFNESQFYGKVISIKKDRTDHNSLKIYFENHKEFDLTWISNREYLLSNISIGDTLEKRSGNNYIIVHGNHVTKKIKIEIIK